MLGLPGTFFSARTPVVPGSQTFTVSGTFVVPSYNNLVVEVWGAGGGASGQYSGTTYQQSQAGGLSSFNNSVIGYGGDRANTSVQGIGGSASGGDINLSGESGGPADLKSLDFGTATANTGKGGDSPFGGLGGNSYTVNSSASNWHYSNGNNGLVPGGGGGGAASYGSIGTSPSKQAKGYPGGGGGGYAKKTYSQSVFNTNTSISVIVGIGGLGAYHTSGTVAGSGANGMVKITWS